MKPHFVSVKVYCCDLPLQHQTITIIIFLPSFFVAWIGSAMAARRWFGNKKTLFRRNGFSYFRYSVLLSSVVNFTIISRAAFLKAAFLPRNYNTNCANKEKLCVTLLSEKTACKKLLNLTPFDNFVNILQAAF